MEGPIRGCMARFYHSQAVVSPWGTGSRGAGGPHQGLDGIRLKLQHPLQVKRLGVPLDGGGRRPSPAVGRGQPPGLPLSPEAPAIPLDVIQFFQVLRRHISGAGGETDF